MRMTRTHLAKFAAIAMMSVSAMALSVTTVAAADLSAADLASINSAMSAAITGAGGDPAKIAAAISSETQALITQYGQTNPMLVAEAAITAAGQAGATPGEVGTGMAGAALAENGATGLEIAGRSRRHGAERCDRRIPVDGIRRWTEWRLPRWQTRRSTLPRTSAPGNGGGGNGNAQGFFSGGGGLNGGGGGGGGCRNPSCT